MFKVRYLLKSSLFFFIGIAQFLLSPAQDLSYLPPVLNLTDYRDSSISFYFTSLDVHRFKGKGGQKYCNALQIIDAHEPWPPRWYASTPVYTDSLFAIDSANHNWRLYFLFDPKVDGGYFSFFKSLTLTNRESEKTSSSSAYIMLNSKMEPVDSVNKSISKGHLYFHDFRINTKRERLIDVKIDTTLDFRRTTGDPKDSAVRSKLDIIYIIDSLDHVLFSWNPLEHLNPDVFEFKESLMQRSFSTMDTDLIEWSRLTSAVWDYDGNILYSMRFVGAGKISRADGHVMWHVDFTDIPFLSGKDTVSWYSIHDFNFIGENDSVAIYSLYSLGSDQAPDWAKGVVFEVNKKTNKIRLVRYIYPKDNYIGEGQGSIDIWDNGDYLLGYGLFPEDDSQKEFRNFMQFGNTEEDTIYANFQLPKFVYTYKVHKLQNWPPPPRPKIVQREGNLIAVGNNLKELTWYKLSGHHKTTVKKVGTGNKIKYEPGVTYCVESKYGIGFSVSLQHTASGKKRNEPY